MSIDLGSMVQTFKDFFDSFQWNPFALYSFTFARGLEWLLDFVILCAVFQFVIKIKRSLFI